MYDRDLVEKGQPVGTIGNCDGKYLTHLHFEMKHEVMERIGSGYSSDTTGYLPPTEFISANRK